MRYSLNLLLPCLLVALPACASSVEATELSCSESGVSCTGSTSLAVYGDPSDINEGLVATAIAAKQDFIDIFGRLPSPTIIVPGGTVTAERRTALNDQGYSLILPWVSASDRTKLREASIRKQLNTQLDGQPEAIRSAALQQALAALAINPVEPDESKEKGALAHELAHLWFIDAFRHDDAAVGGHAYGGWAPDWLDETAAVLMENNVLKTRRRAGFKDMDTAQRIPLAEFLTMRHPAANAARDLMLGDRAAPISGETRTIVLSGEEAEKFIAASGGDRTVDFYSQVMVFSDYLQFRTGSTTIVADIATALSTGRDFEAWLSTSMSGLPKTIDALEADWTDYLSAL